MFLIPVGNNYTAVEKDIYDEWGGEFFCLDSGGYAVKRLSQGLIRLHSIILHVPKGMAIDHKNRNKLDNRRSNLRLCTQRQNSLNRPPSRGRYKGVFKHAQYNKWCAQFCRKHLGVYETEEEAGEAYNKACSKDPDYEYCFLNFTQRNDAQGFKPTNDDVISAPFKGVSKYKGVTKADGGWIARATKNGKREYLGYYSSEDEAYIAIKEFKERQ